MENQYVLQRLSGIQSILKAVHQSNKLLTSATKGRERSGFIDQFLSEVLPRPFRFGSGDTTDAEGNKSGELDIVVEFPFSHNLPLVGPSNTRLYLAESIACVIEVKSNVASQWDQVKGTASQLAKVKRKYQTSEVSGRGSTSDIPLFAVGYEGWSTLDTVKKNLDGASDIHGILVIDPGLFLSSPLFNSLELEGPWSLWGLIACLNQATTYIHRVVMDPMIYVK